ncbi:MAG: hypothetical protein HFF01_07025, partial [Erysipelotrichaceae bacterium]|nr:hypothetical protein [Erysipelotrichaceae bacterium]
MKKRVGEFVVLLIIIPYMFFCFINASQHENQIKAATPLFPVVKISQFSKIQLDTTEVFTALDTTGKFLSDHTEGTQVLHNTMPKAIHDSRNSTFISSTTMPSFSDVSASVSSDHLNSQFPHTDRWWLSDTNPFYGIDSARVVNANNNLNDREYVSANYNELVWNGYLPIDNENQRNEILYDPTGLISYKTVVGTGKSYAGGPFSIELCQAVIVDDIVQPCNTRGNPSSIFQWDATKGYFFAKAQLDLANHKITLSPTTSYMPNDLVAIGELVWTGNGDPYGISLMVVGGNAGGTIPGRVENSAENIYTWGTGAQGVNLPTTYKGTMFGNIDVTAQKAHLRPMIKITPSQIFYVSKKNATITPNTYKAIDETLGSGVTYLPHVIDHTLQVTNIRENESGKVKIDASLKTIKIPKGTTVITLPIDTTAFHNGYERYISAFGNNKFGQIGKMTIMSDTMDFDVSAFINTSLVGTTQRIQLYAEDMRSDGTNYISEPFEIELEIVEEFKVEYQATPKSVTGVPIGTYQHLQNVNSGDKIGEVKINNGIPAYALSLVDDTSNTGDYQYFELSQTTNINLHTVDVKVKPGTLALISNSLKAGTYSFCVEGRDDSGTGNNANQPIKVCTTLNVDKAKTTIVFNDPNMTKKSINNASTSWSELATASPSAGTKITYTKVGGDIGMINIDPDTGAITYNGGNAFGKVKIRATVDDDPSTGDDNYIPSYVEKEIVIYREVDGVVTPDPVSSDTTIPTFSAGDTNIKTGGTIGKIQGTL